jgi:hypothetical protein
MIVCETFTGNAPTVLGGVGGIGGAVTDTGTPGDNGAPGLAGKLLRMYTLDGSFA